MSSSVPLTQLMLQQPRDFRQCKAITLAAEPHQLEGTQLCGVDHAGAAHHAGHLADPPRYALENLRGYFADDVRNLSRRAVLFT